MKKSIIKDLIERKAKREKITISHDGMDFAVEMPDMFEIEEIQFEAEKLADDFMQKSGQAEWKNEAFENGKSKWEHMRTLRVNTEYGVILSMSVIRKPEGGYLWENEKERAEFKKYLLSEQGLFSMITEAIQKKMAIGKKQTPKPSAKKPQSKKSTSLRK